jgi:hypothetical protein
MCCIYMYVYNVCSHVDIHPYSSQSSLITYKIQAVVTIMNCVFFFKIDTFVPIPRKTVDFWTHSYELLWKGIVRFIDIYGIVDHSWLKVLFIILAFCKHVVVTGAVVVVIIWWLYGCSIYNYICNQCLSPLQLWARIPPGYKIMW